MTKNQRIAELEEQVRILAMALILNEKEWISSLEEMRKMAQEGYEWTNPFFALSANKVLKSLSRDIIADPLAILRTLSHD